MKLAQVAIQFFTLRAHTQTAAELAETARKVRAIGYETVQLSGLGPIPVAEIAAIMHGEGLKVCATHEPSDQILDQPERCIEKLRALDCTLTAYPYPRGVDFTSAESIDTLVRKLAAAGEKFTAAGMKLGYHNHGIEFVPFRGKPVLDYIYAQTTPAQLVGEPDTYWIHYGGGDVVEWCEKLAGRLPFIHLKDYVFTPENKPTFCEIGAGHLRFDRIIAAAERSGCEWFIVEQDTCPGDPFVSIQQSFDYLKTHLVG
jgi:sugar phosphate isomerase/epimerase